MTIDHFSALQVETTDGVATVTLAHPPLNLLDSVSVPELKQFFREIANNTDIRVVVLKSGDPDFFAAHVDFEYMRDPGAFMALGDNDTGHADLNPMHHLMLAIRSLPQVTIAQLHGRLRGGGNEIATAMDMRFAAAGETWLSQVETRLGIMPGGGGTQLVSALVGRARALEAILSGDLIDAETAERWGWVNRALPPEELDSFVSTLARRIARLTTAQIAAVKDAVNTATGATPAELEQNLKSEGAALGTLYPPAQSVVDRMISALDDGIQTRANELDLENALDQQL